MKLKTLKDFVLFQTSFQEIMGGTCLRLDIYPEDLQDEKVLERLKLDRIFVNIAELKQEAIKWVKEDRKRHGVTFQGEFWQENLNITEEDLK